MKNDKAGTVEMASLLEKGMLADCRLPLFIGRTPDGENVVDDFAKLPHLIVGGATGQGKSCCLHTIIFGLVATHSPEDVRLILADPKRVEFAQYANLPHLGVPVIVETRSFTYVLRWLLVEMERRLKMLAAVDCSDIHQYNASGRGRMPSIVVVVDEFADCMAEAAKEVVPPISRLTSLARAAGIHLILSTSRPDRTVLPGELVAGFPGRIAFRLAGADDSRTILGEGGAEKLAGRGDALYRRGDGQLIHLQGAYVGEAEQRRIVAQAMEQYGTFAPLFDFPKTVQASDQTAVRGGDDPEHLFEVALKVLKETGRASTAHFQRRLGIGYNHASRLLDLLEARGIIGPQKGPGSREILVDLK